MFELRAPSLATPELGTSSEPFLVTRAYRLASPAQLGAPEGQGAPECLAVPVRPGLGRAEASGGSPSGKSHGSTQKLQQTRSACRHAHWAPGTRARQAGLCRLGQGWARLFEVGLFNSRSALRGRDRCACHPGRPLPRGWQGFGSDNNGLFCCSLGGNCQFPSQPSTHLGALPPPGPAATTAGQAAVAPEAVQKGKLRPARCPQGPPQGKAAPFSLAFWSYVLGLRLGSARAPWAEPLATGWVWDLGPRELVPKVSQPGQICSP